MSAQSYAQASRVFATAEFLRQSLHGWTLAIINKEVGARLGEPMHIRTTRRDLLFLQAVGLAERTQTLTGYRWRWKGQARGTMAG